jgi:hypothetical protein
MKAVLVFVDGFATALAFVWALAWILGLRVTWVTMVSVALGALAGPVALWWLR